MAVHQRNTASSLTQEPPLTIARVALYARVSTLNGQDPEMQLRELREYASRRGWTITSEYVDQGVSGSKESRPELNQLMADAHRRKFDAVLVWKIDRFGRSLKHLVNALADLCAYGVAFVSFRDNLDLSTPSGRLMFQIIGAMAEFERSLIQERVRAGLRNARAKGKKFGRPRAQVDAVRVAALRQEGLSWSQVCRTLNVSKGECPAIGCTLCIRAHSELNPSGRELATDQERSAGQLRGMRSAPVHGTLCFNQSTFRETVFRSGHIRRRWPTPKEHHPFCRGMT
jgi:DNA invertase Pin-like site-specific DNA recombinase